MGGAPSEFPPPRTHSATRGSSANPLPCNPARAQEAGLRGYHGNGMGGDQTRGCNIGAGGLRPPPTLARELGQRGLLPSSPLS